MLTLYSFGPGANSLKPMATLYEKGLPFNSTSSTRRSSSSTATGSRRSIRAAGAGAGA